ncbi:DoxX family protein [Sinomicrobium sp. M5D2P17]
METIIVLTTTFVITLVISKIRTGKADMFLSGRVAMAFMLILTGTGHFLFTEGMALMLPDFIPAKETVVLVTGVLEIIAAVALLIPFVPVLTGWLLIVFFLLILPSNIYAAMHHVNLKTATHDGEGPLYLWFRVPLQLFFIAWVYFFIVRNKRKTPVID